MTDDTSPQPNPYPIDVFVTPSVIAVIGATEEHGSFGRTALWNLISNPFGGTVYPIHPYRSSVLGIKAYPHVSAVPEQIDLAIIVTPTSTIPLVIRECAQAKVKGAIIVTSGFRALGTVGIDLEQQALAEARRTGMRLIGPNSLGLIHPQLHLNASCARTMPKSGNLAFISHSAALATAVLDWSIQENIGFSHFISLGSMLDIGWGDMIDYLGDDPSTESIVIYMESIGNAGAFLSAAREVALSKPIVVLKAGRTSKTSNIDLSSSNKDLDHDQVFDAALRRCGVLRVNSIAEMFAMADALARQPRPRGPKLSIITNAGGPGILAADTLISSGGLLATLNTATVNQLDQILPTTWAESNPIDLQGDANPERYRTAIEIVARDSQVDGLLIILNPTLMSEPTETALLISRCAIGLGKPILASWMGGGMTAEGAKILKQAGIPVYAYPDDGARTFAYMWQYSENLRSLYETPSLPINNTVNQSIVTKVIEQAYMDQRLSLYKEEARDILEAYNIPTLHTYNISDISEALYIVKTIGFPVTLKVSSSSEYHEWKNILSEEEIILIYKNLSTHIGNIDQNISIHRSIPNNGYNLVIGSFIDIEFGPTIFFKAGGHLGNILQDRAIGIPPLNSTLARRMMERTSIFHTLPISTDNIQLDHTVIQFSQLLIEQPRIKRISIEFLYTGDSSIFALETNVDLHPNNIPLGNLPKAVIRPYPAQYIWRIRIVNNVPVLIRPIRPEDEPLMIHFHQSLSEQSIYYRFFRSITYDRRVEHERLSKICFLDYDREIALVAIDESIGTSQKIVGVGRLTHPRRNEDAEFALLVSDQIQGKGLGKQLLRHLIEVARQESFQRIVGYILPENRSMIHIAEQLGFRIKRSIDINEAVLDLHTFNLG